MKAKLLEEVQHLPAQERIELAEAIWTRLPRTQIPRCCRCQRLIGPCSIVGSQISRPTRMRADLGKKCAIVLSVLPLPPQLFGQRRRGHCAGLSSQRTRLGSLEVQNTQAPAVAANPSLNRTAGVVGKGNDVRRHSSWSHPVQPVLEEAYGTSKTRVRECS